MLESASEEVQFAYDTLIVAYATLLCVSAVPLTFFCRIDYQHRLNLQLVKHHQEQESQLRAALLPVSGVVHGYAAAAAEQIESAVNLCLNSISPEFIRLCEFGRYLRQTCCRRCRIRST